MTKSTKNAIFPILFNGRNFIIKCVCGYQSDIFSKISQLRLFLKCLAIVSKGLLIVWQHFEPTLANILYAFAQVFFVVNGQMLNN